jgi:hypothetical protein
LEMGGGVLMNCLPSLALNRDPSNLSFPSRLD